MSKKRKKIKELKESQSVKFELEDDADEIFEKALNENWDPPTPIAMKTLN